MEEGLKCSLCSRNFARHDLAYNPVGGGVRYQSSDYLCRQCWQVISGQPWPGDGASPEQQGRPPMDRRQAQQQQQQQAQQAQQQALLQQQMQQAMQQQQQQQGAGSPLSIDMLQRSMSASMSGLTAQQAVQYTAYQQQLAAQQRQQLGSPFSGLLQQHQQQQHQQHAGGPPMLGRRSQSFADFQFGGGQGVPIGGGQPHRYTRQPASMPEQPALLGSSDDPRWGNLAAASEPRRSRGIPAAGRSGSHHHLGASAPVQPGLLSSSVAPQFRMGELGGMLDEASLELFESQSHLLDPDSLAALQKQRQLLEWQAARSAGDEAGTLAAAASLERQDSAGSGNEPMEVSNAKRQLKAALVERDAQVQRVNELTQQLQDKKRQLFSAIQERESLRQQNRQLEDKCREFQEALQCKLCRAVQRNCVVLPCLHFLYCDTCVKQHCGSNPSCPACNCSVTGFQTLLMHPSR